MEERKVISWEDFYPAEIADDEEEMEDSIYEVYPPAFWFFWGAVISPLLAKVMLLLIGG